MGFEYWRGNRVVRRPQKRCGSCEVLYENSASLQCFTELSEGNSKPLILQCTRFCFESLLGRVLYIWGRRFEELQLEAGFRFCGVILVEASNTSQGFTIVDIFTRKRVKGQV